MSASGVQPVCLSAPCGIATYLQGTMAAIRKSDGRVVPMTTATGLIGCGRLKASSVQTANDAERIEFEQGVFLWENGGDVTAAMRYQPCYGADNQTVYGTDGSGTRSKAGIVIDVTSEGVWVLMSANVDSETPSGPQVMSKSITTADLSAAATSEAVDFDAALPAGAIVIGSGVIVSAIFDNAGDSASCSCDIGVSGGDADAFVDGASLNAVATPVPVAGVSMGGLVGAITPAITVISDVNVSTLTKGACVAYVAYFEAL